MINVQVVISTLGDANVTELLLTCVCCVCVDTLEMTSGTRCLWLVFHMSRQHGSRLAKQAAIA